MTQLALFPAPNAPTPEYLVWCKARGINLDALRCSDCGRLSMSLSCNDFVAEGKYCADCFDWERAKPRRMK